MSRKNREPIKLSINAFGKKGHGFGMHGEKAVEVPFTIPGDHVVATPLGKKKGVVVSRLEKMVEPSADRQASRCAHFGVCGGCLWQQMGYPKQLEVKQQRICALFAGMVDPASISPILPSDPEWGYRNKMEFTFSENKLGDRFLGLIMSGSRGKVLTLQECHLAQPWMVDLIAVVQEWWEETGLRAYHPHTNVGSLRTLTAREGMRTGDRMVILTVSGHPDYAVERRQLDLLSEKLKQRLAPEEGQLSLFLKIHQAIKGQPTQFYEMHLGGPAAITEKMTIQVGQQEKELTFNISPAAFFQPNTRQAEKMYSKAVEMASIGPDDLVYDLYCGTGTLALCASVRAGKVVGVELSPEAVLDAEENAKANGMDNVVFYKGDVGKVLDELDQQPSLVFVDPPRAGLDAKAVAHLLRLKPKKIVYISCNPHTQVENIKDLINGGYCLEQLQPVDQFPHTVHLENIALLVL